MRTFITSIRFTKALAIAMSAGLITSAAFAQSTSYTDVPEGSYYEEAAAELLKSGALDANETKLRPYDIATRAEVMKLLVNVNGTALVQPTKASFSDVSLSAWYAAYIETAAREGWIQGDRNCYSAATTPCTARPAAAVNRAEMAIILQRAFQLGQLNMAPEFSDNKNASVWFYNPIQTAADHCILQGDAGTGLVRPEANMNRAEMIVMFHRASQQQRYGQDCAEPLGNILDVTTPSARRVKVAFNIDLDPNRMGNIERYTVEEVGGAEVAITSATVLNGRILELNLSSSLESGTSYRLKVENMQTENGNTFSDTHTFLSTQEDDEEQAGLGSATIRTAQSIRLTFTSDLDVARAGETTRYVISPVGTGGTIGIQSATLVDARTVDLSLTSPLQQQRAYTIRVNTMLTEEATLFSDSGAVIFGTGSVNATTSITGAQEVPAVVTTASGTGTFVLTASGLQYDITVKNMSGTITGAHFHSGVAGVSGPVVRPITFTGNRAQGTWTGLTNDQRNAILNRSIYVNVHTTAHPDGEIRGQVVTQ